MLTRSIEWVKTHKLATLLLLLVAFFLFRQYSLSSLNRFSVSTDSYSMSSGASPAMMKAGTTSFGSITNPSIAPQLDYAPAPEVSNRIVVQNSYLSLLVTDVVSARKQITDYAVSLGGYMVNTETSNPQDAPTATVTVRVPSDSLDKTLEKFRALGVKVVSENLIGNDVTDQYVDIDARVTTLEKTKAAMEAILSRATLVSDLTTVTREVINIQSQIDNLKGQQKSLAENAKLAKITVYMSTDEIALPYAPSETFRPAVIFKLAVRALTSTLRSVAAAAIWILVYSVIWIPVLILLYLLNKYLSSRTRV